MDNDFSKKGGRSMAALTKKSRLTSELIRYMQIAKKPKSTLYAAYSAFIQFICCFSGIRFIIHLAKIERRSLPFYYPARTKSCCQEQIRL